MYFDTAVLVLIVRWVQLSVLECWEVAIFLPLIGEGLRTVFIHDSLAHQVIDTEHSTAEGAGVKQRN